MKSISIYTKDLKVLWRSPVTWVVMAALSFILAWLFWQMLDQYVGLQDSFAALPNPPTVTQSLWTPYVLMVAKVMMLFMALSGSLAVAQERAQNTLWYLLINRSSCFSVVWAKFKAQWMVLLLLWLHLAIAAGLLFNGGALNWPQVAIAVMGFTLFMLWLMALGILISSHCQSTGTAVLLSLVVFVAMWMLGGDMAGEEYGLNWLKLFSPQAHLKWFCAGELSLSSLVYFLGGCSCFLWLTTQQLTALRNQS